MNWKQKSQVDLIRIEKIDSYLVRIYPNRIAIQSSIPDAISWETLQDIKTKILGDVIAIEIFPKNVEVVNFRNTRHLWFGECLDDLLKTFTHPEFQ
jgi:hypothetical protein